MRCGDRWFDSNWIFLLCVFVDLVTTIDCHIVYFLFIHVHKEHNIDLSRFYCEELGHGTSHLWVTPFLLLFFPLIHYRPYAQRREMAQTTPFHNLTPVHCINSCCNPLKGNSQDFLILAAQHH